MLFEEKLELFDHIRGEEPVTWSGTQRAALENTSIFPTTAHDTGLPTWVAVGGSPDSAIRAAKYGMGLELAIIGSAAHRFAPFADLYRKHIAASGFEPRRIAVHSHGFIAATDEEAMERYYPYWHHSMSNMARERGWPQPAPDQFAQEIRHGALHLSAPETVARKIVDTVRALGATRFGMNTATAACRTSS